jgi:IMP dehydrogenase/GMP reductase
MIDTDIKFDFNDIFIVPAKKTHINSRYEDITLPSTLPLFTAPMDSVVDLTNAKLFKTSGINVVLPRTVKYVDFLSYCSGWNMTTSFGFDDLDQLLYKNKIKTELHENANILIDVANGHMQKIVDYCQEIKRLRPDIKIMVGNIANPETYFWYAQNNCVSSIRLSIGSGSACLSTKHSAIGYPSASLIQETYQIKKEFIENNPNIKAPLIIADGGMKNYSDVILALALGSDGVMIGSIFNKAIESCGKNYLYGININQKHAEYFFKKGFPIKKHFQGMSTKEVQRKLGKTNIKTSEGVQRYRKVEYTLNGWIENFKHYLRNTMSYCNCKTLDDFIGKVNICQITKNAYERINK